MEEKNKNAPTETPAEKAEELSDEMLEDVAGGYLMGFSKESMVRVIKKAKEKSKKAH